ncbi:MAG: methyl-accepting chemotaxis protein [Pseudomonadota bacterium]|nr:methyl-accepting chemotaxis protein [Pseudomonadota bacterium]
MHNITVRFSLMSALGLFSAMILLGALLGVFSLGEANKSTIDIGRISAQSTAINDVYKETMRVRTSFLRAFVALKEAGDEQAKTAALKSATDYIAGARTKLAVFDKMHAFEGSDEAVKKNMMDNAEKLCVVLTRGVDALARNDTAAFMEINSKEITAAGAVFTKQLNTFQDQSTRMTGDTVSMREGDYARVLWMVGVGLSLALALVVTVHVLLKRIVIGPLDRAVTLLEQVAHGDLTMQIDESGRNEIAQLFGALKRMQQGLLNTVTLVRTGADVINTGAQEIAAGNMDLSSRTENQASSLEETAASIEELTGTVRQNAENALQANQLVQAASATAVKGGEVMGQMVGTMTAINDSSRKIFDIISVIDSIAFQTNILALNAAVEAARAGEQGRGFAVVATEVRNLAHRSAAAAKEIKVLIDDSMGKVASGSKLVEQAGMTMSNVVDSVQRVTDIVSEIAEASREQSEGISQVNQAIAQMDEATQQNAALVEQAAAATQSLQSQATILVETVSIFKIDARHLAAPTSAPTVAARPAPRRPPVAVATPRQLARPDLTKAKAHQDEWEQF